MKFSDSVQILFEDSHILIAYKPAGMVVPVEERGLDSLEGYLKEILKKKHHKETIFLKPIHRLDKPVSGLVLFARSSKALSRLNQTQRERGIEKFYIAKVSGTFVQKRGLLIHQIDREDFRAKIVPKEGKEAKLLYRVLSQSHQESLLSLKLLTGRYHQIRAQLSFEGHPILGDVKYKGSFRDPKNQIALCHTKMIFPHPTLKKRLVFKWRPAHL